jgi:quinolinate synthase
LEVFDGHKDGVAEASPGRIRETEVPSIALYSALCKPHGEPAISARIENQRGSIPAVDVLVHPFSTRRECFAEETDREAATEDSTT